MGDYYCPNCDADLELQFGFDPDEGYWRCTECGQELYGDDLGEDESRRFPGTIWHCDTCDAVLNKQNGFDDWLPTWTCTECGSLNFINEDEIVDDSGSAEDSGSASDSSTFGWSSSDNTEEDEVDYYYGIDDDDPSRQYPGVVWHCESCDANLNGQEGFDDWCGTWECTRCGTLNFISEDTGERDPGDETNSDDDSHYAPSTYTSGSYSAPAPTRSSATNSNDGGSGCGCGCSTRFLKILLIAIGVLILLCLGAAGTIWALLSFVFHSIFG